MSLAIKTAKLEQRGLSMGDANEMGDPGLFGFLGKVAKSAVGIATSFIPGPAGALIRGVASKFAGRRQQISVPGGRIPQRPRVRPGIGRTFRQERGPLLGEELEFGLVPPRFKARKTFGRPGAPQALVGPPAPGAVEQPGISCPQGMRPNKSDYWRADGNGSPVFVEKGTRCVSVRRRNPGNSRANDRAIARIASAKRMAKTLGRISIRKECP